VLKFMTQFFKKLIAVMGLPPSQLKTFETMKENSAN